MKKNDTSYFHSVLIQGLKQGAVFTIALLFFRLLMMIFFSFHHYTPSRLDMILLGGHNEVSIAFSFTFFALLLNLIPKIGKRIVDFVALITLLFSALNQLYFIETFTYFNLSLLNMASGEITSILNDYGTFKWYYLLPLLVVLIYLGVFKYVPKTKSWTLLCFVVIVPFVFVTDSANLTMHERNFSQSSVLSFLDNGISKRMEMSPGKSNSYLQSLNNGSFVSEEYPLLYLDTSASTLAPFFKHSKSKPNLVYIFIESLPGPISCKTNGELSFTPFLDSLAQHSLKFNNFLSTAERTFAVLPSVLASLPHGELGFTDEVNHFPDFYSVPEYLNNQNYQSNFFYGGDANFDNMSAFLKFSGVQNIYDKHSYKVKLTAEEEKRLFGLDDRALFEHSFDFFQEKRKEPFLDIYLTLSTHFPFEIKNQDKYIALAKDILQRNESIEKNKMYKKYLKKLSTVVYLDEVLENYFNSIKNTEEFKNTIFVICGDHMMIELPHYTAIERYNTPLLIYSPLLKRTKEIKAVNSHYDMAPSLLKLLSNNFSMPKVDTVSWLGRDLDTSIFFKSNRSLLFMYNDRKRLDFLQKDVFYQEGNRNYQLNGGIENLQKIKPDKIKYMVGSIAKDQENLVLNNRIFPKSNNRVLIDEQRLEDVVFSKTEFISFKKYIVTKNISELEIDFGLKTNKRIHEDLSVIVNIRSKNGENKHWESIKPHRTMYKIGDFWIFEMDLIFKNNYQLKLEEGDEVSVYFWNSKKIHLETRLIESSLNIKVK